MCNIRTSTYSLCAHKGPTTITRRCPGYIDSGFEITCDDPAKRQVTPAIIDAYCLGCRPVEYEDGESEVEKEFERRRKRILEEIGRKKGRMDDDDEVEWTLIKPLEKKEEEEMKLVCRGGKKV